ncbi:DUF421 domain-containing protein [Flavitalea flava]
MDILINIFGEGKDLSITQMSFRGILVFFIALLLIRISGRRSFSLHTPLDNIITIALGAILSRAIVGASDFMPIIICSTVIVLLHRVVSWLVVHNKKVEQLVEGKMILLFKKGSFIPKNMSKALVCQEDVLQGVRKSALTEDMEKIDKIYIEKNGEISAIKKA